MDVTWFEAHNKSTHPPNTFRDKNAHVLFYKKPLYKKMLNCQRKRKNKQYPILMYFVQNSTTMFLHKIISRYKKLVW